MSTRAIDSATAEEHLRDGQDNIKECVKTLQRVQKHFPEYCDELAQAIGKLGAARTEIDSVARRLKRG